MITQVVTTAWVIGTGPIWNKTADSSGRVHVPALRCPPQHQGPGAKNAGQSRQKRSTAGLDGEIEASRKQC
jgi:hypothetical protein